MPAYPIVTVSRMTGLSIDTLRAWEKRYALVAPARDASGLRRYSDDDVARLELARAATALGHPIRWVAKHSDDQLRALVRAPGAAADEAGEPTVRAVLEHLGRYDTVRAERALNAAALLMPGDAFVLAVLAPLLRTVGLLWEAHRVSVAQEHLISQVVRNVLARLVATRATSDACAMLFVTPPGELHELGIHLAATLLAIRGERPCMLGAAVPASDVAAAARFLQPRAVVVGTAPSLEASELTAFLLHLDAKLPQRIALLVGGDAERAGTWPRRAQHVARLEDFASSLAAPVA